MNYVLEEIKDPLVNLPRAVLIAVPIVMVEYLCVNITYLTVLSPAELIASQAVAVVLFHDFILMNYYYFNELQFQFILSTGCSE